MSTILMIQMEKQYHLNVSLLSGADAHDSLGNVEILYELALTDLIPVSMMVNVGNLPESYIMDNHEQSRKLDWMRLTGSQTLLVSD